MRACQHLMIGLMAVGALLRTMPASADYFVATNGAGDGSGSWANATNSIQGVIGVAPAGSVIWISNGVYKADAKAVDWTGTNVVYITNSLTLRAWNGPGTVVIDGGGSNRCLAVRRVAALYVVLDGLTLTNGYSYLRGGGLYIEASGAGTAEVFSCAMDGNTAENVNNIASAGGGGAYVIVSGGFQVAISNCFVRGNRAALDNTTNTSVAGGAWLQNTKVYNTEFSGNDSCASAGGIWSQGSVEMYDCRVQSNTSAYRGGGMYIQGATLVERCRVQGNVSTDSGGGLWVVGGGDLRNTLVVENSSASSYGGVYGYYAISLYNCTIASNTAVTVGGLNVHASANPAQVANCIIYDNSALNWRIQSTNAAVTNTCTTPLTGLPAQSSGNIEGPPLFAGAGDYHLQLGSSCINAGLPLAWMPGAKDLDGFRRVDHFSGKPDMGCYEYQLHGTMFRFQ